MKIVLAGVPNTFRTKISKTPVVLGGLPNLETGTGIVQVRIKKHRWFERILKSKDALIISAGWRRFQTLPVYYMDEDNGRHRHLKYTPEHMHCNMEYSGHLLPTNTGLCCFRRLDNVGGFRVVCELCFYTCIACIVSDIFANGCVVMPNKIGCYRCYPWQRSHDKHSEEAQTHRKSF